MSSSRQLTSSSRPLPLSLSRPPPRRAAQCAGVEPSLSRALTPAPSAMRAEQSEVDKVRAARCSGVRCLGPLQRQAARSEASRARSVGVPGAMARAALTVSTRPVDPTDRNMDFGGGPSTGAPSLRSHRTTLQLPSETAYERGHSRTRTGRRGREVAGARSPVAGSMMSHARMASGARLPICWTIWMEERRTACRMGVRLRG